MRKLRRLPWRIPKSHHQPSAPAEEACPRREPQEPAPREIERESMNLQPVAFAGGRYVYGDAPKVACSPEIRRKTRHRTVRPLPIAG